MWREITESDLQSAISGEEDRSFRNKLLVPGQDDPYATIFGQVTLTFREAIRTNTANILSPDPATLPEAAIFHAVAIIRHRLVSRFASTVPSEARMEEYKEARKYLESVASGGRAVEQAGVAENAPIPLPPMAVNESPRRGGWRNQDGI